MPFQRKGENGRAGTSYKRQGTPHAGYRVAVAASRRRVAGDVEGCEEGKTLLWRTVCTNIDGRYVLSWAANPRVALSTDLLPLVFGCRYRIR